MTVDERSTSTRANHWCIAAVDQAIGRLSTEVARMDAIDLAAPWKPSEPDRRTRIETLLRSLGADAAPDADGRTLAAALVRAWVARRDTCTDIPTRDVQTTVLDTLTAVHELRIALDAGIHTHDVASPIGRPGE